MAKILEQVQIVDDFTDEDYILGVLGNQVSRTSFKNVKKGLIKNNDLYLNQVAFYIDVNEPASTPLKVNIGGNKEMFKLWKNQWKSGVMDANGNWAELNKNDNRYFADGTLAVDLETGEIVPELGNCNFMGKIPKTGCYLQTVEIAGSTIHRLWLSLLPLPGWTEPEQYTGMYKAWTDTSGRLRSLPNQVPTRNKTVKSFWDNAQLYGKDFGLAGVHFRNMLLWYMMAAYGQRGSQECALEDGTPVWGVGLDGTESAEAGDQYTIKTGSTLSLGTKDGKVDVLDSKGATCHSVKVLSYENPWGQFFEMDGHLCSIGNNVVVWRDNFMPISNTPALSDFAKVNHAVISRHTDTISNTATSGHKMNLVTQGDQGAFMIPMAAQPGVRYGDYFSYAADGQLWLWGGGSSSGAYCGLAYASSDVAWTRSSSRYGARLAFFGEAVEVTGRKLMNQ